MKRALVSFQGRCPLQCRHCYTTELYRPVMTEIEDVVKSIQEEHPDIIYVSHDYENFFDQKKGIELCESLYGKYRCHMIIITRMALKEETINRIKRLSVLMKSDGKTLFFSESVFAMESYTISECCAEPKRRIETINCIHDSNIPAILMLRPVFPRNLVKLEEYNTILDSIRADAVVTSGLIVTDGILAKLGLKDTDLNYGVNLKSEYLSSLDEESVRYVDVHKELEYIKRECEKRGLPCYPHSMDAINSILKEKGQH